MKDGGPDLADNFQYAAFLSRAMLDVHQNSFGDSPRGNGASGDDAESRGNSKLLELSIAKGGPEDTRQVNSTSTIGYSMANG